MYSTINSAFHGSGFHRFGSLASVTDGSGSSAGLSTLSDNIILFSDVSNESEVFPSE